MDAFRPLHPCIVIDSFILLYNCTLQKYMACTVSFIESEKEAALYIDDCIRVAIRSLVGFYDTSAVEATFRAGFYSNMCVCVRACVIWYVF